MLRELRRRGEPVEVMPRELGLVLRGIAGLEAGPPPADGAPQPSIAQIVSIVSENKANDDSIRFWEKRFTNPVAPRGLDPSPPVAGGEPTQ